jgi:hypothetical protein
MPHLWPTGSSIGSPLRLRPGVSPQTLRIPSHDGHPVLHLRCSGDGQQGITPTFGYSAPYPSAGGTSTLLIYALPSAHYEPLRLPLQASAISFPYTHWLVDSPPPETGLQHWTVILQKHAIPATPGGNEYHFRCSSTHPTVFPFCPQGRLHHFVHEATCRFTDVTACFIAGGKLTTLCLHNAAFSCYRGVRTTPQTGL